MTDTIPNVPRELLEVIEQTWRIHYRGGPVTTDLAAEAIEKGLGQLRAILSAPPPAGVDGLEPSGYDDLWAWFGMSYSSWLTLPRSLMHSMPDDWQKQMAGLLDQWDAAWNTAHLPAPYVSARDGAKFTRWPEWLLNYRRPAQAEIERVRATVCAAAPNIAPTSEHSGS